MNDWVDVNCFFTVGRGMLHGLVPYRDLYEQKGPLVYFVYALASLVSESSFLGVYLLEGLCFACFLHIGGNTAETLSGHDTAYWPSAALLSFLVPITPAFSHGGSAEEFILPVLALGFGLVIRAMGEKRPLTRLECFSLGLCAAAALWTKYTFCGLFAGLAAAVLLWYAFTGKARDLLRLTGFALLGSLALSCAIVSWFALKGALPDLWQAYFVNNLSRYAQNIRGGAYDAPLPNLLNNLPWSVPGAAGLIWLLITVRKRGWAALAAWAGAAGLFLCTYASGRRYPYYALVLAVFAPLGLAAVFSLVRLPAKACAAWAVLLLAAGPWIALKTSGNTYLMNVKREDMPPYRFAETIRQSGDSSLLNYGFLDGGFYFAAGTVPTERFFCTFNIDLKEMETEQRSSIDQGRTEFVVTRQRKLDRSAPYHLADEASMVFEGRPWTYYLYQRNE